MGVKTISSFLEAFHPKGGSVFGTTTTLPLSADPTAEVPELQIDIARLSASAARPSQPAFLKALMLGQKHRTEDGVLYVRRMPTCLPTVQST